MSILLDAGPTLNFLAVGQQNALLQIAQTAQLQLSTPERVDGEIVRKATQGRFAPTGASATWKKLKSGGRVQVLSDELTDPAFTASVARISGLPAVDRVRDPKSLGEIMVLAHASVRVQRGGAVFVLIDDGDGRARGEREARRLKTLPGAVGGLILWDTKQVLKQADQHGWLVGDVAWQRVYEQMRKFDDGLPPLRSEARWLTLPPPTLAARQVLPAVVSRRKPTPPAAGVAPERRGRAPRRRSAAARVTPALVSRRPSAVAITTSCWARRAAQMRSRPASVSVAVTAGVVTSSTVLPRSPPASRSAERTLAIVTSG